MYDLTSLDPFVAPIVSGEHLTWLAPPVEVNELLVLCNYVTVSSQRCAVGFHVNETPNDRITKLFRQMNPTVSRSPRQANSAGRQAYDSAKRPVPTKKRIFAGTFYP